mgnify:CR=1 FL=1
MDVEAGREQAQHIAADQDRHRLGINNRLKIYLVVPVVVVIIFLIALLLTYFATDCVNHSNQNALLLENSRLENAVKNLQNQMFQTPCNFSEAVVNLPEASVYVDTRCHYLTRYVCSPKG